MPADDVGPGSAGIGARVERRRRQPIAREPAVLTGGVEPVEDVDEPDLVLGRPPLEDRLLGGLDDKAVEGEPSTPRVAKRGHAAELLKGAPERDAVGVSQGEAGWVSPRGETTCLSEEM